MTVQQQRISRNIALICAGMMISDSGEFLGVA